jgi:threonine dehydratase
MIALIYRKKIYGGQWHGLHSSFDDHRIIEGQGTVGVEILEDLNYVDYLFLPIGGGGLCAGVGLISKLILQKQRS